MQRDLVAVSAKVVPAMSAIWGCSPGNKRLAAELKEAHSSLLKEYDPSGVAMAHLDRIINS